MSSSADVLLRTLPVAMLSLAVIAVPVLVFEPEGLPRLRALQKELMDVETRTTIFGAMWLACASRSGAARRSGWRSSGSRGASSDSFAGAKFFRVRAVVLRRAGDALRSGHRA